MKWPQFDLWRLFAATTLLATAACCWACMSCHPFTLILPPIPILIGGAIGTLRKDFLIGMTYGLAFSIAGFIVFAWLPFPSSLGAMMLPCPAFAHA